MSTQGMSTSCSFLTISKSVMNISKRIIACVITGVVSEDMIYWKA